MGVLIREIALLYAAISSEKPDDRKLATASLTPLPSLPIQYADFAHWQREWLQGEVLETQLSLLAAAVGRHFYTESAY
jgi:hypothetical protein